MDEISNLSWKTDSLKEKWQLVVLARTRYKLGGTDVLISYISTLYSVMGTALCQLRRKPYHMGWAMVLLFCMVNQVWFLSYKWDYSTMTADECDVLQSVFRMFSMSKRAYNCIQAALQKEEIALHTEALLKIGLIWTQPSDQGDYTVMERIKEIAYIILESNPGQSVRILRGAALLEKDVFGSNELARELLHDARTIAQRFGLHDQLVKI